MKLSTRIRQLSDYKVSEWDSNYIAKELQRIFIIKKRKNRKEV